MGFLSNPTFWTGTAFFLFFAILYRYKVHSAVAKSLDDRSSRIEKELNEARQLREEAEALLASFQSKRQAAELEAREIVENATREAERQAEEAKAKTEDFIRRRTASAEARIAQAEAQAAAQVRAAAADAAIRASEIVLRSQLTGNAGEIFLSASVQDIKHKLN